MNFGSQSHPWSNRSIGEHQRYVLEQRLGQGGMGNVYVATDTLLGRQVAIKILKETLINTEAIRKRFEREVSLCAALHSENIVQVTDYGITPEGHPFFVMEYLVGQTLGQLLQQQRILNPIRTVQIITQVCHGLNLAHEGIVLHRHHGRPTERIQVIHRDLKPDNLFLVPTTLGELVKILDFGIAKLKTHEEGITDLNTSSFIGTYHYASPEQLELSTELGIQSDIYSLGVILYEMLSGRDPFGLQVEQPQRGIGMSWVKAHLTQAPIPLRSLPDCHDLPSALEATVMKCLAKKPSERWESVVSLSLALRAAVGTAHFPSYPNLDVLHLPKNVNFENTTAPGQRDPGFPQLAPSPSEFADSVPNEQVLELEKLLAREIGPMASMLLPPVLKESISWGDVVQRLVSRVPEARQAGFRDQAIALEKRFPGATTYHPQRLSQGSGVYPQFNVVKQPESTGGAARRRATAEQLKLLEQRLAHYVGPIAKVLLNQLTAQRGDIDFNELVQQLAQKIPDPRLAEEFERSLH